MPTLRELFRQTQNPNEHHDSTIPGREFRYLNTYFLNGGDRNMGVNGPAGPGGFTDFAFGPPIDQIWFVEFATIFIHDPGDMNFDAFGSIAALANGLQFLEKIEGNENEICNLTDNLDIELCFFGSKPRTEPAGNIDNGFLNDPDLASGRKGFKANIVLDGSDGDQLIMRVRDDLTAITQLAATAQVKIPRIITKI